MFPLIFKSNMLKLHLLRMGWRNFFPVVLLCVGFWFWQEIGSGFTYLCTQSTIQLQCCVSFLVLAGNSFCCYVRTQCTIQLCDCVSFLVVVGNSSQNENMSFLQKDLIGLLCYDPLANVCISQDLTLFYSVSFFFLFLLYHADPQVEVQIRILLKDKYKKLSQNVNTGNHTLIS